MPTIRWSHPSVTALLNEGDPEQVILGRARQAVFEAIQAGWMGPPFDPIALADLRGLRVESNPEVVDARTSLSQDGKLLVEFNPNQPRGRRRYSIAHEIAHSFFADVAEAVRHRAGAPARRDDWQLEMLCNMAAAELLMPVGSLAVDDDAGFSIDEVLSMRTAFDVSVEAVTLRLARLARRPLAAFVASSPDDGGPFSIDYLVPSPRWGRDVPTAPPANTVLAECRAIGYTAKAVERWPRSDEALRVEAVGLPPYPGHRRPRVAGLIWPTADETDVPGVLHVRGSATEPRGAGAKLLIQVVNDRTPRWGGGFALEVARRWPHVQRDFIEWTHDQGQMASLGAVRIASAADDLRVASIVAQHGYGPSRRPRIRYGALEAGLREVAAVASETRASVHAPRLGAGQAGGNWAVVEGLLVEILCAAGVSVTIYSLPGAPLPQPGVPTQLVLGK